MTLKGFSSKSYNNTIYNDDDDNNNAHNSTTGWSIYMNVPYSRQLL